MSSWTSSKTPFGRFSPVRRLRREDASWSSRSSSGSRRCGRNSRPRPGSWPLPSNGCRPGSPRCRSVPLENRSPRSCSTCSRRSSEMRSPAPFPLAAFMRRQDPFTRYRVNLVVDNSHLRGAPVIEESNPTYYNLLGKVEYRGEFGALVTDFTMIKCGALQQASGGFLTLQVRDVLTNPLSWEALKRALKSGEARIENIGEQLGLMPTATLRPEPIPLDVKVLLIGTPQIFQLLYVLDEDFRKLFKIKAEFDVEVERTQEATRAYVEAVGAICNRRGLRPFDRSAVARVLEHSARLAEHQQRLSTRFNDMVEIIFEASAWAQQAGHDVVAGADVDRAVDEKVYRSNRIEERLRQMIAEGQLLVDVDGVKPGQVNGLSVLQLGDYSFGHPSRITARTFVGSRGVVNIERETEMSGRIHSKGVAILAAYMGGKYAQQQPLSLNASLTFEQTYSEVEGDSASSTELYALLSELSAVPIEQSIAVTGSVNQKGEIRPSGGAASRRPDGPGTPRTTRKTSSHRRRRAGGWIWVCGARLRSWRPPAAAWGKRWRSCSSRKGPASPSARAAKRLWKLRPRRSVVTCCRCRPMSATPKT